MFPLPCRGLDGNSSPNRSPSPCEESESVTQSETNYLANRKPNINIDEYTIQLKPRKGKLQFKYNYDKFIFDHALDADEITECLRRLHRDETIDKILAYVPGSLRCVLLERSILTVLHVCPGVGETICSKGLKGIAIFQILGNPGEHVELPLEWRKLPWFIVSPEIAGDLRKESKVCVPRPGCRIIEANILHDNYDGITGREMFVKDSWGTLGGVMGYDVGDSDEDGDDDDDEEDDATPVTLHVGLTADHVVRSSGGFAHIFEETEAKNMTVKVLDLWSPNSISNRQTSPNPTTDSVDITAVSLPIRMKCFEGDIDIDSDWLDPTGSLKYIPAQGLGGVELRRFLVEGKTIIEKRGAATDLTTGL